MSTDNNQELYSAPAIDSLQDAGSIEPFEPTAAIADFNWLPSHYQLYQQSSLDTFGCLDYHHFVAADERDSSLVVISAIPEAFLSSPARRQFIANSKKLSKIKSESFLAPIEWGFQGGFAYNARRYVSDVSVLDLFERNAAQLNNLEKLIACRSIIQGLAAVHNAGCVQRQFHSWQLIVQPRQSRLSCAGPLVYATSNRISAARAKEFAETSSPEFAGAIDSDIGASSDLYSFGVLMFRIFTNQLPFTAEDTNAILLKHMTCAPDWELFADVEAPIVAILKHLLNKDPSGRYQTAQSVMDDLELVIQSISTKQPLVGFFPARSDARSSLLQPRFVGREQELAELSSAIENYSHDSKKICVLGASGLGKTRFVVESLRAVSKRGVRIFDAKVSRESDQVSMAPIIAIAQQIDNSAAELQRLRDALSDHTIEIARAVPELAQILGWPIEPAFTSIPDNLGHKQTTKALAQFLANLGSRAKPAVVWIDDCQWLDSRLLDALKELDSLPLPHTTLVLSMRNGSSSQTQDVETAIGQSKSILLDRLTKNEVTLLLESMAGRIPNRARQLVIRMAEGSPFMASAIVHGLVETGSMHFTEGSWEIDESKIDRAGASSDAADLLAQRIDFLPITASNVLKLAAINGKTFSQNTIADIGELSLEATDESLSTLRSSRLIWQRPDGDFVFVHDKIRETTLGLIDPETQKSIHLSIAKYLVSNRSVSATNVDARSDQKIAYHFHKAGRASDAYQYARRAGDDAKQKFSLDTAIEFYQIAVGGSEGKGQQENYQHFLNLAEVLMLAGKYHEAQIWFDKAAMEARFVQEESWIDMKIGELAFKKGDKKTAVTSYEASLEKLGCPLPRSNFGIWYHLVRELTVQVAHSLFRKMLVGRKHDQPNERQRRIWKSFSRLAHGYWFTKGPAWVVWAHLRGMNEAEVYPPTEELAQAYSDHAPAMSLIPWLKRGEVYAQRSLKIREDQNNLWGRGQSKGFRSILLYAASKFEACIEVGQSAETILKKTGDVWEMNIASYHIAAAHMRLGNLAKALEVSQRVYQTALSIGDFQSTGNIIDVWVRSSPHCLPPEVLSLEKSRHLSDTQTRCQISLAEGINLLRLNKYAESIACFEEAILRAKDGRVINTFTNSSNVWLVEAQRRELQEHSSYTKKKAQQTLKRLYHNAKRAVRVSRRFKNDLPHAYRELASACALTGRNRKALGAMTSSIRIAREQSAQYELALSLKSYHEIGTDLGWPDVVEANEKSEELFSQLNVEPDTEERPVSMSLVEQFDVLLDAGREIFVATSPEVIFHKTLDATKRILRVQRIEILLRDPTAADGWRSSAGSKVHFDLSLVSAAIESNKTVVRDGENIQHSNEVNSGTYLCSPIHVGDQVEALLYLGNEYMKDCFGENEVRIADYIANAAGSALQKADGFKQLAELNRDLEQKVMDRTESLQKQTSDLEQTADELRLAQRDLERARIEAENANQTKSDFLARMSHEIRTPISAVMGYTELMLSGIVTDPNECRDKLETISASGKHLLSLVNDLLDLGKIEADMLAVESIPCSPAKIIQRTYQSMQAQALQKGIEFRLCFDSAIPKTMVSDPTRLTQIITNLLSNAIKFTSHGSVVVIVRHSNVEGDDQLDIEIHDTGIGMTEEQLGKIFDPFVQADTSTTRKFGGTGLGLSITRQLTQLLGGSLAVESKLGEGSTFTATIPVVARADSRAGDSIEWVESDRIEDLLKHEDDTKIVTGDLSGIHVLIVDDATTNQELLSYILTNSNAQTTIAENGREAIDLIEQRDEFDVVLMDMQMPVMDGKSATQALRAKGFTKPIIAITANTMKGDEENCIAAGCSGYMSKPIDTNQLMKTVCHFANRNTIESDQSSKVSLTSEVSDNLPEQLETYDCRIPVATWESLPNSEPFRGWAVEFVFKLQDKMLLFTDAISSQDTDGLRLLAHWAKGTAGTIHLNEIAELAADLETTVVSENWDEVALAFERLKFATIVEEEALS